MTDWNQLPKNASTADFNNILAMLCREVRQRADGGINAGIGRKKQTILGKLFVQILITDARLYR